MRSLQRLVFRRLLVSRNLDFSLYFFLVNLLVNISFVIRSRNVGRFVARRRRVCFTVNFDGVNSSSVAFNQIFLGNCFVLIVQIVGARDQVVGNDPLLQRNPG
jgi:hypothetical protein